MIDVRALREQAALRAAGRPRPPFQGTIQDREVDGIRVRDYKPHTVQRRTTVWFAHGGYGIFGDVDLQDGYCRLLAAGLGCRVVAVDYRLAPEHTFEQAVDDVLTAITRDPAQGLRALCGDSAGGAVVTAAAARVPGCAALLLTNPNLDLTLSSLTDSDDGPDPEILRFAFTAWMGARPLAAAPQLHLPAEPLPPAFVAVGDRDSLAAEAESFARSYRRRGWPVELLEFAEVGHGFIGDAHTAHQVISAMDRFLDRHL